MRQDKYKYQIGDILYEASKTYNDAPLNSDVVTHWMPLPDFTED
jgi:hypothetical protein